MGGGMHAEWASAVNQVSEGSGESSVVLPAAVIEALAHGDLRGGGLAEVDVAVVAVRGGPHLGD